MARGGRKGLGSVRFAGGVMQQCFKGEALWAGVPCALVVPPRTVEHIINCEHVKEVTCPLNLLQVQTQGHNITSVTSPRPLNPGQLTMVVCHVRCPTHDQTTKTPVNLVTCVSCHNCGS